MMKNRICGLFAVVLLMLSIAGSNTTAYAQTLSPIYDFGTISGGPISPTYSGIVAQGRDGNLYSTTPFGGANGEGAMFKITTGAALTVPYSFASTNENPYSGLTLGTDGSFYGTTYGGGTSGLGTVFTITPSGTVKVLYNFTGSSSGSGPFAPPIQGSNGDLFGTTTEGGTNNDGTVYSITPSGTLVWSTSFDGTNGNRPFAPLVQGNNGSFYGTTELGGTGDAGVVFKITPAGTLTSYSLNGGELSFSPLVQGSDGNFYGTTSSGGTKHYGAIFKMTPGGTVTVIHDLNGTTDGAYPFAGLVQATDGNFYGTTSGGPMTPQGTIFSISPTAPYPYTVLQTFDGTTGAVPYVTLVQHTNGILYGDTDSGGDGDMGCTAGTCGVFYSLDISAGPFVSLVSTSGKVGNTVEVLGQGFKGTTGVFFNGTSATFKVSPSDTYLTATVPTGATKGFVTVVTPSGTLTSNKEFVVKP
jgi:uncharacterized repeat protein (TIGR03803 family)